MSRHVTPRHATPFGRHAAGKKRVVINPPWVLVVKSDADICPLSVFGTPGPQLIHHGTLISQLIPDNKRGTVASHKILRGRDVRANPAAISPVNHAE